MLKFKLKVINRQIPRLKIK